MNLVILPKQKFEVFQIKSFVVSKWLTKLIKITKTYSYFPPIKPPPSRPRRPHSIINRFIYIGWKNIIRVAAIDCANDINTPICREYDVSVTIHM